MKLHPFLIFYMLLVAGGALAVAFGPEDAVVLGVTVAALGLVGLWSEWAADHSDSRWGIL